MLDPVFVIPVTVVILLSIILAIYYKGKPKVDKGFVFSYHKLTYRKKMIRSLTSLPIAIAAVATLLSLGKIKGYTIYGSSRYFHTNSNIFQIDMNDKDAVKQLLNTYSPDVIIWALLSRENEDRLINKGLTNLLAVISKETKLIFISTDAVFSIGEGDYTESDKPVSLPDDAPLANYVNSKIIGEESIKDLHPNHIIIRTGPLYGMNANGHIEKRTKKVIRSSKQRESYPAEINVFKTFVHVDDLSKAILELIHLDFSGILHVGPAQKLSYFSFLKSRLCELGYDETIVVPTKKHPIKLDTSLNTSKARSLLKTRFRKIHEII